MPRPWSHELAVFDLETTGIDVETARIVTAHVGVIDGSGAVLDQWQWLADPGVEIPEGASAIHGITTERARAEGRPARAVVGEIVATLDTLVAAGLPLVIYNAPYDLTVLAREARRHRVAPLVEPRPVIDPLVIDKHVDRYRRGKRTLSVTSAFYGVQLEAAHDASADAVAAGRVALALAAAYGDRLGDDGHALHDRQSRWCRAQAASFQEYMRREKDPEFVACGDWPERLPPAVDLTPRLDAPAEATGAREVA